MKRKSPAVPMSKESYAMEKARMISHHESSDEEEEVGFFYLDVDDEEIANESSDDFWKRF